MLIRLRMLKLGVGKGRQVIKWLQSARGIYVLYRALVIIIITGIVVHMLGTLPV